MLMSYAASQTNNSALAAPHVQLNNAMSCRKKYTMLHGSNNHCAAP